MRSASPGFQGDRPGSPGFQLAQDGGFQTQGAAELGALELQLTLDGTSSRYSPRNAEVGELALMVTLDGTSRGPRPLGGGGARPGIRRGIRFREEGQLELVLSLEGYARFVDEIEREDEELLLII